LRSAIDELDPQTAVFVSISVEPNDTREGLAAYAEREGFGWTFAVATPEILQGMIDSFGRGVSTPPSRPHFLIRPDGTITELATGSVTPEQFLGQIGAASG
jgi:cytochrome oxidase Cu insertion factor (SCO1/SenC/PrrC family)